MDTRKYKNMNLTEHFGCNVFHDEIMKNSLPREVYKSLRRTIDEGEPLDSSIASAVANAMKDWAVSKGATHYTHWFQPLTNLTAEKHDSFYRSRAAIKPLQLTGKNLIGRANRTLPLSLRAAPVRRIQPEAIRPGIRRLPLSSRRARFISPRCSYRIRARRSIKKRRF